MYYVLFLKDFFFEDVIFNVFIFNMYLLKIKNFFLILIIKFSICMICVVYIRRIIFLKKKFFKSDM